MTWDVEKAKSFYARSIGWTYDSMAAPDGTYWLAEQGETMVAGLFEQQQPDFDGVRENWVPYLAVDDVDARVEKAVALGAILERPIFDVPGAGVGWMTPAEG